jgi:hypothetical protein
MTTRRLGAAEAAKAKPTTTTTTRSAMRRRQAPEDRETKPETPGTSDSSGDVDGAAGGDPLRLEGADWTPPESPDVAVPVDDDYEPPPPELIEWTPDRAAAIVKGGGLLLHVADPLAQDPGGEELWRATEQDAADIGAPLSRILNRYAPARRLAGVADEGELAFATVAYAKRNLVLRGQLVRQRRAAEAEAEATHGGTEMFQRDEPTE